MAVATKDFLETQWRKKKISEGDLLSKVGRNIFLKS